ncbi:MAG: hypothetical protein M0011_11635, partial [Elusimicrobia bacterium]|nr:hypothetical protein [Elusimicrobiota bacterium]
MHEESVPAGDPRPAAAVKAALRVLALCALLFVPARGISWAAGWLYAALYAGWSAAVVSLLGSRSPDLLRLRELERPAPAHWWDRAFGFAVTSLTFVMLAVCGADSRSASGWGSAARVSAFLAVVLSYALALWALGQSPRWRTRVGALKGWAMLAFGLGIMGQTLWHVRHGIQPQAFTMGWVAVLAML